jgi:hypothetical protein
MCLLLMCFVTVSVQGDSGVMDITAGDDFLGLCDKKCSYQHGVLAPVVMVLWVFFNSHKRTAVNHGYNSWSPLYAT